MDNPLLHIKTKEQFSIIQNLKYYIEKDKKIFEK